MEVTSVESKLKSSEKCIAEALRAEYDSARRRKQQRGRHDSAAAPLLANSRKPALGLQSKSVSRIPLRGQYLDNQPRGRAKSSRYPPSGARYQRMTSPRLAPTLRADGGCLDQWHGSGRRHRMRTAEE
eukprot:6212190-Pleurochrysis_carterae.AAC.5